MKRKTYLQVAFLFELFMPHISFILSLLLIYVLKSNFEFALSFQKLESIALQFCSISMGFLLTVLTLIRGFKSTKLELIRTRNDNDYNRLLKYIRSAILNSFLAIVFIVIYSIISEINVENIELVKSVFSIYFFAYFMAVMTEFLRLIIILARVLV